MVSREEQRARDRAYSAAYRARHPERRKATVRAYYERNRDTVLQKAKERNAANPQRVADWPEEKREANRLRAAAWQKGNPERYRANARRGYQRNREQRLEWMRQYRLDHRAEVLAREKLWREAQRVSNPDYAARKVLTQARRRARERNAPGVVSPDQLAARMAYFGHRCWMCGGEWEAVDHVIPLAKGGTNWPANLRPACRSCNSRKRDRIVHRKAG